jgi:hypothetical protein
MANRNFIFPVKWKRTREEKYALLPPPQEEVREWAGLLFTAVVIIANRNNVPAGTTRHYTSGRGSLY